jgi:ATP-dependent protease ClpP protease subunit
MPVSVGRATYELCVSIAASAIIALLVLLGGDGIGRVATSAPTVILHPPAHVVEPMDSDIDPQDAVLATRRKAASREIERQWHTNDRADANPLAPAVEAATTSLD